MLPTRLRTAVALLAMTGIVSACTDREITGPAPESADLSSTVQLSSAPSLAGMQQPAPGHLVIFKNKKTPAGFEQAVADLGGTVDFVVPQIGFASVSGLDDAGATAIAGHKGVSAVEIDALIELDLPEVGEVEAADVGLDPSPSSSDAPATSFFFARQWHHRAIGADIAWAAGQLGSSPT